MYYLYCWFPPDLRVHCWLVSCLRRFRPSRVSGLALLAVNRVAMRMYAGGAPAGAANGLGPRAQHPV